MSTNRPIPTIEASHGRVIALDWNRGAHFHRDMLFGAGFALQPGDAGGQVGRWSLPGGWRTTRAQEFARGRHAVTDSHYEYCLIDPWGRMVFRTYQCPDDAEPGIGQSNNNLQLCPRFTIVAEVFGSDQSNQDARSVVYDGEVPIYRSRFYPRYTDGEANATWASAAHDEAEAWLTKHYPLWGDPAAYWHFLRLE